MNHIAESSVEGCYVYTDVNGVKTNFCGLTKLLASVCYPSYDYQKSLSSAPIPKNLKQKTGLTRPWQGQARGRLAHDQVRALVNGGEHARSAVFGAQRSENADNFIASLDAKKLKPLVAEYIVYSEDVRLASGIDLLCMTNKERGSKLVLIELKNFCNGFEHSNDNLKNPPQLRHLSNCPLHQAFLQLAFYRHMVASQHPNVEIGSCYVVQETQTYTKFYRLPAEFVDAAPSVVQCIFEARLAHLAT